jgi:hypothetical protein
LLALEKPDAASQKKKEKPDAAKFALIVLIATGKQMPLNFPHFIRLSFELLKFHY